MPSSYLQDERKALLTTSGLCRLAPVRRCISILVRRPSVEVRKRNTWHSGMTSLQFDLDQEGSIKFVVVEAVLGAVRLV
jgi:hypothetical protein